MSRNLKEEMDANVYIGTKIIKATLITKKEYCDYRGWEVPSDEDPNEEVYIVEYAADPKNKPNIEGHEGYVSMSPKHVFEKAYKRTHGMTFSDALEAVKNGRLICRKGWNGKGQHVYMEEHAKFILGKGTGMEHDRVYPPVLCLLNAKGDHQLGWVPSQGDLFATDWELV